jgi:tetratricopeptide (TPR) repeat protein
LEKRIFKKAAKVLTVQLQRPVVCPVFIGRASDLTVLHTLIDEAKNGNGQVLLVSGEAGIGKSRLVTEAKIYATECMCILEGNCFESDQLYPYATVLDLLHTFFNTHTLQDFLQSSGSAASEFTKLFPELDNGQLEISVLQERDPQQKKQRLFAALTQFFIDQATRQPVLLIIEDLHWADDSSLEFLLHLSRRSTKQPMLMIFTYRDDEVHANLRHWLAQLERERLIQELALTRFSPNEVEAMVNAIFHKRPSRHLDLLDSLYTLTEGNPFFIEEILKSLIAGGEFVFTDGRWVGRPADELHIPRNIQDAVHQRTTRLSEDSREILTIAAVAGQRFDFALLQQLTHHEEQQLLVLMKELIAAQLVIEASADQFAFRHALTRQAIYAEMLARERRALHKVIAETMERLYAMMLESHLEVLAYHYYKAEVWDKAFQFGQLAGEKAQALYSPRTAIEQYSHALHAAQHLTLTPPSTLYRMRGQAYETSGDFEQAQSDYKQALNIARDAHDGEAEWQSIVDLGFLWSERDYEQAGAYYHKAIELARTLDDPKLEAHSLNRMGNWHMNIEQPLEALRYHREALTIFQKLHDQHGIAETLDLLGMTNYLGGDLVQGTAYYEEAIALFRELDDRNGLTSSLATLTLRGPTYQTDAMVSVASLAEVMQDTEQALKIAREIDQRPAEAYALFQLALCLGSQGEYGRALKTVQQSIDIAEEIEHRQWQTAAHSILGGLYCGLLAIPQALEQFEQALKLAQGIGSLFWMRIASGYLASTLILSGDLTHAEIVLNAAQEPQTATHTQAQRLMLCARIELALAKGNPARALDITDQLIASDANTSEGRHILRVSKLRGEALLALHRSAEARVELEAAQEIAAILGARPMLWRINVLLGNFYLAQGEHEEAEKAYATARTLIEELAATMPDESLRDNFLHTAMALLPHTRPLSPAKARKQAYGGLTVREREVAVLIAQGKSNREIADTLVVSERTIETHVSSILSKLNFTSRTHIATWAIEKGLTRANS